jgi:hypothetical protein
VWPDAPPAAYRYMASHCPRIAFNPSSQAAQKRGLPPGWADPAWPLDWPLASVPSAAAWEGLRRPGLQEDEERQGLSLAQRFRCGGMGEGGLQHTSGGARQGAEEDVRW